MGKATGHIYDSTDLFGIRGLVEGKIHKNHQMVIVDPQVMDRSFMVFSPSKSHGLRVSIFPSTNALTGIRGIIHMYPRLSKIGTSGHT